MVGSLDGRSVVYGSKDGKVIRYNTSYFSINNKWAQFAHKNNCKIPVVMGIELNIDQKSISNIRVDLLRFIWEEKKKRLRRNIGTGTTQKKNNTHEKTDYWLFKF
jgi:hypothetical protein